MTIILARHGESTSNAGAVTDMPGESPLTLRGRRQAFILAAQLEHVDRVITSDYVRAMETGKVVADFFEARLIRWEGIQEWNLLEPSKYGGTTHDDRAAAVKETIERWDPEYRDGPGAESFYELLDRAKAFWRRCADIPKDEATLIVSHGWFMKALLWWFTRIDPIDKIPKVIFSDTWTMRSFWSFAQAFEINNCQHFLLTL